MSYRAEFIGGPNDGGYETFNDNEFPLEVKVETIVNGVPDRKWCAIYRPGSGDGAKTRLVFAGWDSPLTPH